MMTSPFLPRQHVQRPALKGKKCNTPFHQAASSAHSHAFPSLQWFRLHHHPGAMSFPGWDGETQRRQTHALQNQYQTEMEQEAGLRNSPVSGLPRISFLRYLPFAKERNWECWRKANKCFCPELGNELCVLCKSLANDANWAHSLLHCLPVALCLPLATTSKSWRRVQRRSLIHLPIGSCQDLLRHSSLTTVKCLGGRCSQTMCPIVSDAVAPVSHGYIPN